MLSGYISPRASTPQTWWPQNATYALDFLQRRAVSLGKHISVDEAYMFTRATEKLVADNSGNWEHVATEQLALAENVITIESEFTEIGSYTSTSSATIGILGAGGTLPAGWTETATSSGVNVEVLAVGDHKGLPSIDLRFQGTPTSHWRLRPSGVAECNATPLAEHIATLFCSLVSGNLPNASSFQFGPIWYTAANGYLAAGLKAIGGDIDASFQRFSKLSSSPVGCAKANLDFFSATSGIPIDFSIRLAVPNIGVGSSPTTPVLSSGTPKSRLADILTLDLPTGTHRITLETETGDEEIAGPNAGSHIVTPPLSGAPIRRIVAYPYLG